MHPPELTEEELEFLRGVLDLAREGRTGELAAVIDRGVPMNLTGGSGDSLLILAAYHGHPETVRMLLERGADPDRVNDRGQTALGAAVFRRSAEAVRLLLEHGADPHAGSRPAVEVAAVFELDDMAALLSRAPMSSADSAGPGNMATSMNSKTTVSSIGVAMFTVSDQDAAMAFYTEKLGWEVRSDQRFGENGDMRWLEVAPPGSTARLALNPPMNGTPGGGSIGVETVDVQAEHERLSGIDGVEVASPVMEMSGAPAMFHLSDPDGNYIWVVQAPGA